MKINETTFRRILQEESKRVLSESIMLVEDDGPFVLFVGELQNIYLTGRRQCGLHLFAVGFCAGMAGAHTHINAELAHLKTQIQKG